MESQFLGCPDPSLYRPNHPASNQTLITLERNSDIQDLMGFVAMFIFHREDLCVMIKVTADGFEKHRPPVGMFKSTYMIPYVGF